MDTQWSKDHGLLLEAYSPLGSGTLVKETLNVPEIQQIARALSITPAQVIISWHVQRGVSTDAHNGIHESLTARHSDRCTSQEREPLAH